MNQSKGPQHLHNSFGSFSIIMTGHSHCPCGLHHPGGYSWSRRYPQWHMVKEAQLVCVHSSFSKRVDIVSTRKLEQYWLSPQAFTRIKSFHFFLFETAAIFIVLGLYINQIDLNVEIKSSAGFSPSLVLFKHCARLSHQRLFTFRVCGSNSYRQSILICSNWSELLRLIKSLSYHRTAHQNGLHVRIRATNIICV